MEPVVIFSPPFIFPMKSKRCPGLCFENDKALAFVLWFGIFGLIKGLLPGTE